MINAIITIIIVAIVCLAGLYVYSAKKNGRKCIGCPSGGCNCKSSSTKPGQCCGDCGSCGSKEN